MKKSMLKRIHTEITEEVAFAILPKSEVDYLRKMRAEFVNGVSHYQEYTNFTLYSSDEGRYYIIDKKD